MMRLIRRLGRSALAFIALAWLPWASAQLPSTTAPHELDEFTDLAPWHAAGSDGVKASVHPAQGFEGAGMRLDFDLAGTAGYALARRSLPLDLPENYEISFYLRADAPVNSFQLKLVDASGDNVWWFNRPDFTFPSEWRLVRIKKRQIEFAWGPSKDPILKHAASIELVVAAGSGGGRGSLYFSRLALRELPPQPATWPAPHVEASSSLSGAEAAMAVDGNPATAWRSDPAAGSAQTLTVDFGAIREFGGLILRWSGDGYASRYDVELSDDGSRWRTVRRVEHGGRGAAALQLPDAEARFARLRLHEGPAASYAIAEIEVKDLAFGATANAFFKALARESPRGTYPRGFYEQSYWTVVGVDGGRDCGLLSEDGGLEIGKGGFSIEPFIVTDAKTVTWADVETRHSLQESYLPIPTVTWRHGPWELRISSFGEGSRGKSRLVGRYEIINRSDKPLELKLILAVRPFQVDPPTQLLNAPGGVSPIRDIAWDGESLAVDAVRRIYPLRRPDAVEGFPFDAGSLTTLIASPGSDMREIHDDFGYASAAIVYRFSLGPHAKRSVGIAAPLSDSAERPDLAGLTAEQWLARAQGTIAAEWKEKLNRVSFRVPASAQPLVDTLRTALAHILITRNGPILRPGTRSYARSWIRDGSMMAESLLRLGHASVANDYLRWYAPYQFASGKIPCCVDARGADPVPENDSAGEFIYLAAEIYRYTDDRDLLEAMWPHIAAAMSYMEGLRHSERIEANLVPSRRAFYGLLPASISHEGYSEKPMHSYWDDFWALKGFDGAIEIAAALGRSADAARLRSERAEFCRDIAASLLASTAMHGASYVPGAAELADFDPTSTAIAFAPGGDSDAIPPALVRPTYERYWREFVDRRDGRTPWEVYTPYELRTVGTFIRLGQRDRAQQELEFFLDGRRPSAWNQWAEVVGRQPRESRFIGDMPHGWVASDYIRSVLDLFAYERDTDHAIVLGAGIPEGWLDGPGVEIKQLRTPYGPLSYSLRKQGGRVVLRIADGAVPPGGFVFAWPTQGPSRAMLNGKELHAREGELAIATVPAILILSER